MMTKRELTEGIAMLRAEYDDMNPIDGQRLEMWWQATKGFPAGAVKASVSRHITTNRYKPQLADIVKGCAAQLDGNWLGADEAWSLMPKSEHESAMLTDEIAQAMAGASGLIEAGDRVAARMAFKDTYTRLVEKAKLEGRVPRFFPSFGSDAPGRVMMLANAVRAKQITLEVATTVLPEYARDIVQTCGVKNHPLLAGPSQSDKDRLRALLLTMKEKH